MNIKESMDVLDAGVAACDAVIKAYADGKIGFGDIKHLVAPAHAAMEAVRGANKIPDEARDYDQDEVVALIERGEALALKAIEAFHAISKVAG